MSEDAREVTELKRLLEQSAWLDRLAAHLVGGRGDPEDVVQETWLAALRAKPVELRRPRAWLAQLLRGSVLRRARGDARRRAREAHAGAHAAEDSVSPQAAALERLELQRMLTELVTGLDEPFRSTVVMRYFDELSAADVARALKVPEGTVRWRTSEALDRLRTALDRRERAHSHPPTGPSWRRALAALSGGGPGVGVAARKAGRPPVSAMAAGALGLVLAGGALIYRAAGGSTVEGGGHVRGSDDRRGGPVEAGASRALPSPPAPPGRAVLAAYAAVASDKRSPAARLAEAEQRWQQSCASPGEVDIGRGLCVGAAETTGDVCPQARTAGTRLQPLRRTQPAAAIALESFARVQADAPPLRHEHAQATLRLTEAAFEKLLALPPLTGLVLDRGDPGGFARDNQRMTEWSITFGTVLNTTARDFERLAESVGVVPGVAVRARLRLAELYLAGARLKLATEIPSALVVSNRWGTNERTLFCEQIASRADTLFDKAFASLRECLRTSETSLVPGLAASCQRLIDTLPPRSAAGR